ncbi:hypothetical protein AAMO2058_000444300 [Amorphochlora amoebiformis]
MKVGLVSHYAAAKRPYRGIGEGKQIYRAMIWTLAMALGLILLAVWLPAREDGHIDRNWHPTATSQPQLGGFWPFSRNCSKSYHRDLKSITKKLMTAAFATADKNKSGYLEFEEVVDMMHVFYYMSRLDMIDYLIEDLPEEQANATATALAKEYFGNVTNATYQEEAKAFIQKTDLDNDGRLSRKEMELSMSELTKEFDSNHITAEHFIYYLSYFVGTLYRNGMLDGDALGETQVMQILDSTSDPKEAVGAIMSYIKALKKSRKA